MSRARNDVRPTEVVVSGGGVKNLTLMRHLKDLFHPIPVRSIEEFGIPAQAKEPIAFAFFALRALQGKINHLPSATGAKRATVLGKIVRPSTVIASPSDASQAHRWGEAISRLEIASSQPPTGAAPRNDDGLTNAPD